jgi:hypothetical protein
MRRLLLVVALCGACCPALSFAEEAAPPPGETAWLCRSRLGGWVPKVGKLYHCSVVICPPGEFPVVPGRYGMVNNPRCCFVGTQPNFCTFLPEVQRYGVEYLPSLLPPEEVKRRVEGHNQLWSYGYNCQHAAAHATGYGYGCLPPVGPLARLCRRIKVLFNRR